jgi:hypothetical protein
MYVSFIYKDTLGIGDKVVHQQSKAISKYLKDDLCNGMNNTNKRKIRDVLHPFLFFGKIAMLAELI